MKIFKNIKFGHMAFENNDKNTCKPVAYGIHQLIYSFIK